MRGHCADGVKERTTVSHVDDSRPGGSRVLPPGLTRGACDAFRDVEDEFHDGLVAELRRRRRSRPDLTPADVYEARAIVAQAMCQSRPRSGALRGLSTGLVAIGSVGVGSMHPYLNSAWQIALLVVFVVVGLVGVGLMVRDGHPADRPGDPSS
jgi:hypothetical protein